MICTRGFDVYNPLIKLVSENKLATINTIIVCFAAKSEYYTCFNVLEMCYDMNWNQTE